MLPPGGAKVRHFQMLHIVALICMIYFQNEDNSFFRRTVLLNAHLWSFPTNSLHPCSPARSPRAQSSDWRGRTGLDEDRRARLCAVRKTNFTCRSLMTPLPPAPGAGGPQVLTSGWGGRPCCWKTDWTRLHTATETPSARGRTSTQRLLSPAPDQRYYIRLQTKSRLHLQRPLHMVRLMTFVFFSKLRRQQFVPLPVGS